MSGPQHPSLLTSALAYAACGWHIFPCHTATAGECSCRRADCDTIAKHPKTRHGLHDATRDEGAIRRWWQMWPEANVGIRTGAISDLVVLDVDPRPQGQTARRDGLHFPPSFIDPWLGPRAGWHGIPLTIQRDAP
jgi:hypothetical protein